MSSRNKPARQQQITIHQAKLHQGPLPDPETLAQYEQIQPGFANRVITLAEGEAQHRRGLDRKVISMNFWLTLCGMLFGLLSIAGVTYLCHYAFSIGAKTEASAIAIGVLVSVGGVFLWRRGKSDGESKVK